MNKAQQEILYNDLQDAIALLVDARDAAPVCNDKAAEDRILERLDAVCDCVEGAIDNIASRQRQVEL